MLKNLPSNMVEEAIVILKPNIRIENFNKVEKKKENIKVGAKNSLNSKDYIIKEAESVITQYISNLEKPKQLEMKTKQLEAKYERIKILTVLFGLVGLFGIIVNLI